jgi:hypothetical protein
LASPRLVLQRFALDERAETTLAFLAECFEALGGVPKTMLADRMGCLRGGVVANKVGSDSEQGISVKMPAPDYSGTGTLRAV